MADITIAVAGPSEGRESDRTREIKAGAEAAASAINAAGGLNGERLVIQTYDDACAGAGAAAAAEKIAASKAALVLGHPCQRSAIAAAVVYGRDGLLFFATAARHPLLTEKRAGPTIFRLSGRDDRQGQAAGALLKRDFDGQAVALVQDRTRYARGVFDAAVEVLKKAGGKEPITAAIIGGDKEYKATVAKTKKAAAIFFSGFPLEAGFLYVSLRQAGSKALFIGSDSLSTDEFATSFGPDATGVRALAVPGPSIEAGPYKALSDRERAAAAVSIFAECARKAGAVDASKIAELTASSEFATGIGPVRFDANGDAAIAAFAVLQWTGTSWVTAGETPP